MRSDGLLVAPAAGSRWSIEVIPISDHRKSLAAAIRFGGDGPRGVMDAPAPGGLGGRTPALRSRSPAAHAVIDVIEEEGLIARSARWATARTVPASDRADPRRPQSEVRALVSDGPAEFLRAADEPDAEMAKALSRSPAMKQGLLLLPAEPGRTSSVFLYPLTIRTRCSRRPADHSKAVAGAAAADGGGASAASSSEGAGAAPRQPRPGARQQYILGVNSDILLSSAAA